MLRFHIIRVLQITTLILFTGRAWQHLFWDAPYEYLFSPQYGFTPWFVGKLTMGLGWFYVLGIIFCLTLDTRDKKWGYTFVFHSAALLLLAHMYRAQNACELPTFFLYVSQFATPVIFYLLQFTKTSISRIMGLLKIALTLTLGGYAWYAFGFHFGQKPEWLEGLQASFGLSETLASNILIGKGITEILLILLLWVRPLQKIAFAGILVWGGLLMISSVGLFFIEYPEWKSGIRSAWELLCLVPNAGLSFAIWRYVYVKKKEEDF